MLVFPGMAVASAFLPSTMLCLTDAALGHRVVPDDPSVPARVRQALDVESGLNDGLAVPFFLVALDISLATLTTSVPGLSRLHQCRRPDRLGVWRASVPACWAALLFPPAESYAGSARLSGGKIQTLRGRRRAPTPSRERLGGSGFIAAFVAGLAFGGGVARARTRCDLPHRAGRQSSGAVTWMGFGALAISPSCRR